MRRKIEHKKSKENTEEKWNYERDKKTLVRMCSIISRIFAYAHNAHERESAREI